MIKKVCVDRVHCGYTLDGANCIWSPHRFRSPLHLLALLQLSCRRFSASVSAVLSKYRYPQSWNNADILLRAASTVAANIMLRSVVAAGFPLFSRQMFVNLRVQWAGTLLACIAAIMIPIPVGLNVFGAALRKKSKMLAT